MFHTNSLLYEFPHHLTSTKKILRHSDLLQPKYRPPFAVSNRSKLRQPQPKPEETSHSPPTLQISSSARLVPIFPEKHVFIRPVPPPGKRRSEHRFWKIVLAAVCVGSSYTDEDVARDGFPVSTRAEHVPGLLQEQPSDISPQDL